jgi:alkanesulfonate monooxygenase SsuD/methylene tetrahydromethanopterin reductase-like flavin-dependent oxidoreductase (luciferase family)
VRFDPVYSSPKPLRYGVPVLVGASSDAGARRAGRLGDGFLPFERDHDRLVRLIDIMRSAAAAAGRDPNDVEITVLGSTRLERVRALAELGVHRMLLFEANAESLPGLGARLLDLVANAT